MLDNKSPLWKYLSDGQRGLVEESLFLMDDLKAHPESRVSDYSYVVFPIAKAYEGFLKQLFLDRGYISNNQYNSTHFRIGKGLSPNLATHLGEKSIYTQIKNKCGILMANILWDMWKRGRNLVFHYFPHNYQALTLQEATQLVYDFISVMEKAYYECKEN